MKEKFFRAFPYLKPVHINNLYDRLLKASNNTLLLLFNNYRNTYELHSLKSFEESEESLNAVIEEDMLSGWLVTDYLANNVTRFCLELESDRQLTNDYMENHSNDGLDLLTTRALKTIESTIGREI